MSITLHLAAPLSACADQRRQFDLEAHSVGEALEIAASRYPALQQALFLQPGQLRSELLVFVNDDEIRQLQGLETPLHDEDCLTVFAPLAAG